MTLTNTLHILFRLLMTWQWWRWYAIHVKKIGRSINNKEWGFEAITEKANFLVIENNQKNLEFGNVQYVYYCRIYIYLGIYLWMNESVSAAWIYSTIYKHVVMRQQINYSPTLLKSSTFKPRVKSCDYWTINILEFQIMSESDFN